MKAVTERRTNSVCEALEGPRHDDLSIPVVDLALPIASRPLAAHSARGNARVGKRVHVTLQTFPHLSLLVPKELSRWVAHLETRSRLFGTLILHLLGGPQIPSEHRPNDMQWSSRDSKFYTGHGGPQRDCGWPTTRLWSLLYWPDSKKLSELFWPSSARIFLSAVCETDPFSR